MRRVQPTICNVSRFICSCKTLYMFQTGFPSIIRSSKLHIQRQVFVRPKLLPAASLARLAGSFLKDKCPSTTQSAPNPLPFLVINRSYLFKLPQRMFTWRDLHQETQFWLTVRFYSTDLQHTRMALRLTLKLLPLTQTPSSCEASRNGKFFGARFFQYIVKTAFPRILQKKKIYRQLSRGDSVFSRPCACRIMVKIPPARLAHTVVVCDARLNCQMHN